MTKTKQYTAQEMRSKADEFKEYLDNPNHFAVTEFDDESRVLMEMLYQAADALSFIEMCKHCKAFELNWNEWFNKQKDVLNV